MEINIPRDVKKYEIVSKIKNQTQVCPCLAPGHPAWPGHWRTWCVATSLAGTELRPGEAGAGDGETRGRHRMEAGQGAGSPWPRPTEMGGGWLNINIITSSLCVATYPRLNILVFLSNFSHLYIEITIGSSSFRVIYLFTIDFIATSIYLKNALSSRRNILN